MGHWMIWRLRKEEWSWMPSSVYSSLIKCKRKLCAVLLARKELYKVLHGGVCMCFGGVVSVNTEIQSAEARGLENVFHV